MSEAEVMEAPVVAEEYASVTISIDHLADPETHRGHTVLKNVWSTETAAESVLAKINYFQQSNLLVDTGNIGMIAKANSVAAVIVYTPGPTLTNVIVDAAIWTDMLDETSDLGKSLNPMGTVLGAHAALITLATDLKRAAAAEGKPDILLGFLTE